MYITGKQLKQIIKEEITKHLKEVGVLDRLGVDLIREQGMTRDMYKRTKAGKATKGGSPGGAFAKFSQGVEAITPDFLKPTDEEDYYPEDHEREGMSREEIIARKRDRDSKRGALTRDKGVATFYDAQLYALAGTLATGALERIKPGNKLGKMTQLIAKRVAAKQAAAMATGPLAPKAMMALIIGEIGAFASELLGPNEIRTMAKYIYDVVSGKHPKVFWPKQPYTGHTAQDLTYWIKQLHSFRGDARGANPKKKRDREWLIAVSQEMMENQLFPTSKDWYEENWAGSEQLRMHAKDLESMLRQKLGRDFARGAKSGTGADWETSGKSPIDHRTWD